MLTGKGLRSFGEDAAACLSGLWVRCGGACLSQAELDDLADELEAWFSWRRQSDHSQSSTMTDGQWSGYVFSVDDYE